MFASSFLPSCFPTPRQLQFQDWEFGVFLHFGVRTFYEGWRDFDPRPMSPDAFNPSQLDCDSWAQTAREAGARYMVMTAKHHDGFCLWPSAFTRFGVSSSPWQNGSGDVVREFTDACRTHDLAVGLYYSPFDADAPVYDDPRAYDDYFVAQLGELLDGRYGAIDILWLDGCGSENHSYDWARIVSEIRRLQPDLLLFNMGDPDFRWVGNEDGVAPSPLWNTVREVTGSILSDGSDTLEIPKWLPAECDCRMREVNWFYSDHDAETVKSLQELLGLYELSVGRGTNLLLNIGPDRRGRLPEPDAARLQEFGAALRQRFSTPLATLENWTRTQDGDALVWEYRPDAPVFINCVVAQEELSEGERVRRFEIEIETVHHGASIRVFAGDNIGHKAICTFAPVRARAVRLRVLPAESGHGDLQLRALGLFGPV